MKVAVAVICNQDNQVLITQRPLHASHGGYWEFPGGKLEDNESATDALCREITEEVGITILETQFLCEIYHQYDTKHVTLLVYLCNQFKGNATARESQMDLRWVAINELNKYQFPEANNIIIQHINETLGQNAS